MTATGVRTARRRRPSMLARARVFWVFALFTVAAVTAGAIALANAPQLRVRAVTVELVPGPVTAAQVRARAAVPPDANLWLLDTHAIARRVEALPYVLTARVRRSQFPQPEVRIAVALRAPTACVVGARTVTVDVAERVLQGGCADSALPRIELGRAVLPDPGGTLRLREATRLLADAATIGARVAVKSVRFDRFGDLEAVDRQGVTLRLGADHDLGQKLALVEPIRRTAGAHEHLRTIDVRVPTTPIVEFP